MLGQGHGVTDSARPSPAPLPQRVPALDALRGLAVIGIVPMNVLVFAMPGQAYINPRAWTGFGEGPPTLDIAVWALVFLLIEDKFRNLFAMMFGAGVAILRARPQARPIAGHYARMAVLFAIGFAHATLLAGNDILRLYALAGLLLPLFLRLQPRSLLLIAAALVAAQLLVAGYYTWGWLDYWWRWRSGTEPFGELMRAEWAFGAEPDALSFELERGRESLAERLDRRLGNPLGPLQTALAGLPSTLAAMLAGVALWRSGLLAGEWPRARLLRLARLTILAALPVLALLAASAIASDFSAVVTAANALVWSAPFDLVLAIGWAALAIALFAAKASHPLVRRLTAVGRMALTNYLATSLVFASIFASWGLGLFGEAGRLGTLATCAIPVGMMLLWSPWWLARFRQGPAEWLWRSVAAARWLPLRR